MKIMVCYNGSYVCKRALQRAKEYLKSYNNAILVLVSSLKEGTERTLNKIISIENSLAHEKAACDREGIACETHFLIRGLPAGKDLIDFSTTNSIDQIFIGMKKSFIGELLASPIARYIRTHATCPVIAVKSE